MSSVHRRRKERYVKTLEIEISNLREQNTSLATRIELYRDSIHNLHDLLAAHGIDIPEYMWTSHADRSSKVASFITSLGRLQLFWVEGPSFQQFRNFEMQCQGQSAAQSSYEVTTTSASEPLLMLDCSNDGSNHSVSPRRQSVYESLTFESPQQMQMESSLGQILDPLAGGTNSVADNYDMTNLILDVNTSFSAQCDTAIEDISNDSTNYSFMLQSPLMLPFTESISGDA